MQFFVFKYLSGAIVVPVLPVSSCTILFSLLMAYWCCSNLCILSTLAFNVIRLNYLCILKLCTCLYFARTFLHIHLDVRNFIHHSYGISE